MLYPVGFGVILGVQLSETLCWTDGGGGGTVGGGSVGVGIGVAVKLTSRSELPRMDTEATEGANVKPGRLGATT